METSAVYIVDASSLIELNAWRHPTKHRKVWQNLEVLVDNDRLLSPIEVYEEIRAGQDALSRWALRQRKNKKVFSSPRQYGGIARQIVHRFPGFVDTERLVPQADPFVVALALAVRDLKPLIPQRCVVITEEKFTPHGRPRIPHVCAAHQLQYMSIHQMYVAEGWEF